MLNVCSHHIGEKSVKGVMTIDVLQSGFQSLILCFMFQHELLAIPFNLINFENFASFVKQN